MNLTPKDAEKIKKLMALALDGRGNAKESDAAGLKAIRMMRSAAVGTGYLGSILWESEPATPMPKASAFDDSLRRGMEAAAQSFMGEIFSGLGRRRA